MITSSDYQFFLKFAFFCYLVYTLTVSFFVLPWFMMTPHLPSFLAFAALFFFGPVVKKKLPDYEGILTREERDFVSSYCSLGSVLLVCAVCGFVVSLLLPVWSWLYNGVAMIIPCVISLIIGRASYQILQERPWSWFGSWVMPDEMRSIPTQGDPKRIVVDFLPGWSVWQRFVHGHWKTNYRWTKEAMMLRTLWAVQHLAIWSSLLSGCIFFLILVRIATLRANLDFVPQYWKQRINIVVGTSIFDAVVRGSRWALGRALVLLNRPSLSRTDTTVLSSEETKPQGWQIPHGIMIGLCIWWLVQYWLAIASSLWWVSAHGTSIAWFLLFIHPLAMLKAWLWFPAFHDAYVRCRGCVNRLIRMRKKNTDADDRL